MSKKLFNTKDLVFIALFAAITAVIAPFTIPLPFSPVPLSLSLFAVFLSGAILDKYSAFISQIIYILLGAIGLPVFSGFRGGLGVVAGATGGYIISYAFMAFAIAFILEKAGESYLKYVLSMLLSLVICYSFGVAWLSVAMGVDIFKAFLIGAVPYMAIDILKAFMCAAVAVPINDRIQKMSAFK
jgi:biotin transport system substrate-specific component